MTSFKIPKLLKGYRVSMEDFDLGDSIGEGGYGKVLIAIHKETNRQCAVKQLHANDLDREAMENFLVEIENLIKCEHMFVLPFLGWTAEHPFSMVTEFMPNGSLYNALRRKKHSVRLTPTDKTCIAIGVAAAMDTIHSFGIIHRDLKSMNILLDDDLRPRVADFGLAAAGRTQKSTGAIGSPHWMAPELFNNARYNNSVDVYSFGILMWEMLTEQIPFKGMNSAQIAFAVATRKERPQWPPETPETFRVFVELCWHDDPSKRPTFTQICEKLSGKRITFPGTDISEVDKLLSDIRKEQRKKKNKDEKVSPLIQGEILTTEILTIEDLNKKYANLTKSNREISEFPKLPEPMAPDFVDVFKRCISLVSSETSVTFFTMVREILDRPMQEETITIICNELYKLVRLEQGLLQVFVEMNLHCYLPIAVNCVRGTVLKILQYTIMKIPGAVNILFTERYSMQLAQTGRGLLKVMAPFFQVFDRMESGLIVADWLLNSADLLLNCAGDDFLHTLYFLVSTFPAFKEAKLAYVLNIAAKAVNNESGRTAGFGLMIILQFFDPSIIFTADVLLRHMQVEELAPLVMSYLLRQPSVQLTRPFFEQVLLWGSGHTDGFYVVIRMLMHNPDARYLLLSFGGAWMGPTIALSLRVSALLVMLSDQTAKANIMQMPETIGLLTSMVESDELTFLDVAIRIILALARDGQSPVVQSFLNNLSLMGFFAAYLQRVPMLNSVPVVKTSLLLVDVVSRVIYVPDFLPYIPYMAQFLQSISELTFPAISAICVLSVHGPPRAIMRNCRIDAYVELLSQDASYYQYAAIIRQNINQMPG